MGGREEEEEEVKETRWREVVAMAEPLFLAAVCWGCGGINPGSDATPAAANPAPLPKLRRASAIPSP